MKQFKVSLPSFNDYILTYDLIKKNLILTHNPEGYIQTDGYAVWLYTTGLSDNPDVEADSIEEFIDEINAYPNITITCIEQD